MRDDRAGVGAMVDAFRVIEGREVSTLVLMCEHASCAIPMEYGGLGLSEALIREHIGWDIGAADVTEALASDLGAPAVLSGVSRLVVDCNRELTDHDLIVAESHGTIVPGNAQVARGERDRRVERFYVPYHRAVDRVIGQQRRDLLLSVHSFTPILAGQRRDFDVGVLFDTDGGEAERLGDALAAAGLRVRYNEPYSGHDGLIFSARTHGRRHAIPYLEVELNNGLLRDVRAARYVAARVASALRALMEE